MSPALAKGLGGAKNIPKKQQAPSQMRQRQQDAHQQLEQQQMP